MELLERVNELLEYNKDTGVFTWVAKTSNLSRVEIGAEAGCKDKQGYRVIRFDKKNYKAHRLAWLVIYGYMPKIIDHINQVKDDNRIENLREVTTKENTKNQPRRSNNTSGCTGVRLDKNWGNYEAYIKVDGKVVYLGKYDKFEDAVDARKQAEVKYGFHENHDKVKELEDE